MSDSSLTHEEKVEKLLAGIIAVQGLTLACLLGSSNLSNGEKKKLVESMDEISDAIVAINE